MLKNQLITPEGTKDYLFEEASAKRKLSAKLAGLFESHGFCEVASPALEFLDVFSVKGHSIPVEYMYKLTDDKGRLMVLRPDSTMPIARMCATRLKDEALPLRLFYNQAVYSSSRKLSGRSEEVLQTGVELISTPSPIADLEILTTAVEALNSCETEDFRLEIGHIGIYNTLISKLCLEEADKEQLRLFIETKNYPALNDILDKSGNAEAANAIKQLPRLFGGEEVFEKAARLINSSEVLSVLSYLKDIYENLAKLGLQDKITVDLGIVNRTDYYTGIVFKGYIAGYGEPAMAGGRYDKLLAQYGKEAGAVGFAVNVDAAAKGMKKEKPATPQMLVFSEKDDCMEAILYQRELTKQGIKTELSLCACEKDAVLFAEKIGIENVVKIAQGKKIILKGALL